MRHQGLFAFLAVLMFTASIFFYVFETKIDGDYDLVKKEGFLGAWKIKSQAKAVAEEQAELEAKAKDAPQSALDEPLISTSDIAAYEQRAMKTPGELGSSEKFTFGQAQTSADLAATLKAPLIRSIPWETWEVKREFNAANGRACRLLPAGTAVSERFSPRNVQKTLFEGRPTAFTVGLRVDPLFRGQLPVVSKSSIEGYLDDHLLAIQPVVVKTTAGYSFTGEVRAAFFDRSRPGSTIEPEGMIASAVQEFRVLGIYDESKDGNGSTARTLVMAFRFMKQESELSLVIGKPVEAFELMLIHLPKAAESDKIEMMSFATAGNRKDLQLLVQVQENRASDYAPVQANIRFEQFKMMGMYPSNPVVTGIQNRIQSSTPVEDLQKKLVPTDGVETVMFSKILDEFVN